MAKKMKNRNLMLPMALNLGTLILPPAYILAKLATEVYFLYSALNAQHHKKNARACPISPYPMSACAMYSNGLTGNLLCSMGFSNSGAS